MTLHAHTLKLFEHPVIHPQGNCLRPADSSIAFFCNLEEENRCRLAPTHIGRWPEYSSRSYFEVDIDLEPPRDGLAFDPQFIADGMAVQMVNRDREEFRKGYKLAAF
jgi:hypothetical protein